MMNTLQEEKPITFLSPALRCILFEAGMFVDRSFDGEYFRIEKCSYDSRSSKEQVYPLQFQDTLYQNLNVSIKDYFIEFGEDEVTTPRSSSFNNTDHNYYIHSTKCLSSLIKQSEILLEGMEIRHFRLKYGDSFLWTQKIDVAEEVHCLLGQKNGSSDLLALLIICCLLERSLGNLYLVKGSQCPAMLKDLLSAPELYDLLGPVPLQVLQIVMGPPISMNLRNVAWHGFLADKELPRRYIYFLLLLTASLGKHLSRKEIESCSIPSREFVSLESSNNLASQFPDLSPQDYDSCKKFIDSSWVTDESNQAFLTSAFNLHKDGKYGLASLFLVPTLEHAFRKLFVQVNDCPARLVTAETTTFFTTFEEILEPTLPDEKENKIIQKLGEQCMDFVHDLLVYPAGPRCRDKLSHGEADYRSTPGSLSTALIVLLAWLARTDSGVNQGLPENLLERMSSYRSIFHPIAILRTKVKDLTDLKQKLLAEVTISPDLETWNEASGFEPFTINNPTLKASSSALTAFAGSICVKLAPGTDAAWQAVRSSLGVPFSRHDTLKKVLDSLRIKTLHRWKSSQHKDRETSARPSSSNANTNSVTEAEVVGLLTRIVEESSKSMSQVTEAVSSRQAQLEAKQLRSRQRGNLKRLMLFVPSACLLSDYVTCLVTWILSHLNSYAKLGHGQHKLLQRHLKSVLQAAENIRTFTGPDKNKWSEAAQLLQLELSTACDRLGKSSYFREP